MRQTFGTLGDGAGTRLGGAGRGALTLVRCAALFASAWPLVAISPAHAGPEGSQVVRGDVNITRNGAETVIRASDRAIINHRSFDIGQGETVRFLQPGADARVLNRITGAAPTRIDGSLLANGRVYIVNPAGVVFGRGATVNVAGLFAAAGNMSDSDFLSGADRVTGMRGLVANEGSIQARQSVVLTGAQVANSGSIVAPAGTVALAAGQEVVFTQREGTMLVRVTGEAMGSQEVAAVTNTGIIDTSAPGTGPQARSGGRVIMAASDVYGLAIRASGTVKASDVQVQGQGRGQVHVADATLDARDGLVQVIPGRNGTRMQAGGLPQRGRSRTQPSTTTSTGGNITITGEQVAMWNSTLDASGRSGGGSVRIGGDVRGATPLPEGLANAQDVSINSTTTIRADATARGDGGKVVVFAEDATRSFAAISARGGAQGGDGGFIETSGKNHLTVRGDRIDAGATSGEAGQWLLDPRNVIINTTGPTQGNFSAADPDVFTPTSDDSIVLASDVVSRLDAGTDVTITTGTDGTQQGDITVDANLETSGQATLRLQAANSIFVNSGVTIGATGLGRANVELIANASDANDPNANAGAIVIGNGASIRTQGGDILLAGGQAQPALGDPTGTGYRAALRSSSAIGTTVNPTGITVTGATIDAGTGQVTIRGVGAENQTGARGVLIDAGSQVLGGTVRIDGLGGDFPVGAGGEGDNNIGVEVRDAGTLVRASADELRLVGTGGTTQAGNNVAGVRLAGALESTAGPVNLTGLGGDGDGNANRGVLIDGDGSILASGNGGIFITGRARGNVELSEGVVIDGRTVQHTGPASGNDPGVFIVGSGRGGSGAGVLLANTANVASSNRLVSIEGDGAGLIAAHGVRFDVSSSVSGVGVRVSGLSADSATSSGIVFTGPASTLNSTSGDLTLIADVIGLGASNLLGSGALRIQNRSNDTTIGLGTGAAGTLSLGDGELANLLGTGFASLNFGSPTAGLITTNALDASAFSGDIGFLGRGGLATAGLVHGAGRAITLGLVGGTATQTGAIVADRLVLQGNAIYTLTNAGNDVNTLAGDFSTPSTGVGAGYSFFYDQNDLTIGAVGSTIGLTHRGGLEVRSTSGTISSSSPITVAQGELTLSANEINVGANVAGPGSIVLQAADPATRVVLGGAGPGQASDLDITQDELNFLQDSLDTVFIGRTDATGVLSFAGDTTFANTTVLRAGGTGGLIELGQTITTAGQSLFFQAPVRLTGNATVDVTNAGLSPSGAGISFAGALDADDATNNRTLTLRGGEGGLVALSGVVGATQRLQSVDFAGAVVRLAGVRTTQAQTYAGPVQLSGDINVSGSGAVAFLGTLTLQGTSTITTAGNSGDDIRFAGRVTSTSTGADLTANAGNAEVIIGADGTQTDGDQSFSGSLLRIRGNVSGAAVAFNGPVVLEADTVTAAGSASLLFGGTVNSEAGRRARLLANSPLTTFSGDVGQVPDGLLGALVTDTAGTTTLNSGLISAAGDVIFNDAVVLNQDTSVRSVDFKVRFGGPVNSDSAGTPRALTINAGTGAEIVGGAGSTAPLSTLATTATTTTTLGGEIITSAALNFSGPALLENDTTLRAPNVTFGGTLDSIGFGRSLTVIAPAGTVSFAQAVGATVGLFSTDITAGITSLRNVRTTTNQRYTGTTRLNGVLEVTTDGFIDVVGPLLLTGDSTVRSLTSFADNDVIFRNTVNSLGATPFALTVEALGTDVVFFGDAGLTTQSGESGLRELNVSGRTTTLQGVRTTGSQLYSGSTFLNANLSSSTAGSIAFGGSTTLNRDVTLTTTSGDIILGAVDSDATARSLTLNTGGSATTRLGGPIGASSRLATLTTNADGRTLIATSQVRTTGDQVYNDAVTLGANTLLEGNDVAFALTLDSDARSTPRNLTVNTAPSGADTGETTFGGRVGGVNPLGLLTTNAEGVTRIGASIDTRRGMNFGDAVVLVSAATTLQGGTGPLTFRQTIDADSSVTDPSLTLLSDAPGTVDAPMFRFGGSVGGQRRLGTLNIGADRLTTWASGIVFSDSFDSQGRVSASGVAATDTFGITTGAGGIRVGRGHKITAFGTLNMTSTGTIALGDVNTLGDLRVTGQSITLWRRDRADLQLRDRTRILDTGTDLVSGRGIDFSVAPTLVGSGLAPTVSPGNGVVDRELAALTARLPDRPITTSTFADPQPSGSGTLLPLDLRASGPSRTNITTAVRNESAPLSIAPLAQAVRPDAGAFAELAELGIVTAGVGVPEIVDGLSGRSFDDRLPVSGLAATGVPASRLSKQSAQRAVEAYRNLMYTPARDERGDMILDEAGNPVMADRTEQIRSVLGSAWERYAAKVRTPTAQGWRAYLESQGTTGPQDELLALTILNDVRDALLAVADLGLSPSEQREPRRRILEATRPAVITDEQLFLDAVMGQFRSAAAGGSPSLLVQAR